MVGGSVSHLLTMITPIKRRTSNFERWTLKSNRGIDQMVGGSLSHLLTMITPIERRTLNIER